MSKIIQLLFDNDIFDCYFRLIYYKKISEE